MLSTLNSDPSPRPSPVDHPGRPGSLAAAMKNLKGQKQALADDQIVEKAIEENSVLEHGLLAIDKRVSILGEIINQSEGRDKIFKVFSGLLKVVKWFLMNYASTWLHTKDALARIKGASTATSNARCFLKLFTVRPARRRALLCLCIYPSLFPSSALPSHC